MESKLTQDVEDLEKIDLKNRNKDLQSKLEWYVQNQALIDAQDSLVESQKKEIEKLRLQVEGRDNYEESTLASVSNRRASADPKVVHDLRKQVKDLEEALRNRNPDSIASLIHASKPSEIEIAEHNQWKKEALRLKSELQDAALLHDKKYIALRQEHEKSLLELKSSMYEATQESTAIVDKENAPHHSEVMILLFV